MGQGTLEGEPSSNFNCTGLESRVADIYSLANSIKKLGYEFEWIKDASDFDKAEVRMRIISRYHKECIVKEVG